MAKKKLPPLLEAWAVVKTMEVTEEKFDIETVEAVQRCHAGKGLTHSQWDLILRVAGTNYEYRQKITKEEQRRKRLEQLAKEKEGEKAWLLMNTKAKQKAFEKKQKELLRMQQEEARAKEREANEWRRALKEERRRHLEETHRKDEGSQQGQSPTPEGELSSVLCSRCTNYIESLRLEAIPDTTLCVQCANTLRGGPVVPKRVSEGIGGTREDVYANRRRRDS